MHVHRASAHTQSCNCKLKYKICCTIVRSYWHQWSTQEWIPITWRNCWHRGDHWVHWKKTTQKKHSITVRSKQEEKHDTMMLTHNANQKGLAIFHKIVLWSAFTNKTKLGFQPQLRQYQSPRVNKRIHVRNQKGIISLGETESVVDCHSSWNQLQNCINIRLEATHWSLMELACQSAPKAFSEAQQYDKPKFIKIT